MKAWVLLISAFVVFHENVNSQTLEWIKSFGGSDALEDGNAIAVDGEGNVYTVGTFYLTTDFDPGSGVYNLTANNTDAFIQKLDANGNFLWARMLGGQNDDQGLAVAVDAEGNVYFAGDFQNQATYTTQSGTQTLTSYGGYDGFLQKLDSDGNLIWIKQIGSNSTDGIASVKMDEQGNICLTGRFRNTLSFESETETVSITAVGNQSVDVYVLKLDSEGNFIWVKRLGGESNDEPQSMTIDIEGNIYLCGKFFYQTVLDSEGGAGNFVSNGSFDCFIVKLDYTGEFIWAKQIGGIENDWINDIAADAQGSIYATGRFKEVIDFDPGTGTYELTSNNFYNAFILKLTSGGEFEWVKSLTANAYSNGTSLAMSDNEEVYLTGSFGGTTDFDFGEATHNLTAIGSSDLFLMKMSNDADLIWVDQVGTTSYVAYGADVKVDTEDNVYTTGSFGGTVDFAFGTASYPATSSGNRDVFVLKLGGGTINVSEFATHLIASLYPNPTNSTLNIQSNETVQLVSIYNLMGELVQIETRNSFSIEHLPTGVYMVHVTTQNGTSVLRIVKQ